MGKKAKAGRHRVRVRSAGAPSDKPDTKLDAAIKEAKSAATICPGERHMIKLAGGNSSEPEAVCTSIDLHETGLGPEHLPVAPLSTVIPVFLAEEERKPGLNVVQMMTPSQIQTRYGDEALGATMDAFHNFTSPEACFVGESPGEVYRHGLAIYLLRHYGEDPPMDQLNEMLSAFSHMDQIPTNPVLRELLDPVCFDAKCRQVRCAVAIRQHTLKKRGHFTIVLAMVLNKTMDIWHSANRKSPGHPSLLQQLRKKLSKKKALSNYSAIESVVQEPLCDPEDKALDDEFAGAVFLLLIALNVFWWQQ